jgi:hypothetical protein
VSRLVRVVFGLRGRGVVIITPSLVPPTTARTRLRQTLPLVRARAKIAGATVAGRPLSARSLVRFPVRVIRGARGFIGRSPGIPLQPIALVIVTRSMTVVARTRDMAATIATRSMAVAARTRDMVLTIVTRAMSGRSNTRG